MKGQKGKKPTVSWYFQDWLSDEQLGMASACARGVWAECLSVMFKKPMPERTGILSGKPPELCRLLRVNLDELGTFLVDAQNHKFCDVCELVPGDFQIKSRRLSREHNQRKSWRDRKKKQRAPGKVHASVQPSRARSLSSLSKDKEIKPPPLKAGGLKRNRAKSDPRNEPESRAHNQFKKCSCGTLLLSNGKCPTCDYGGGPR